MDADGVLDREERVLELLPRGVGSALTAERGEEGSSEAGSSGFAARTSSSARPRAHSQRMSAAAYIAGLQRPQEARTSFTRAASPHTRISRMFLPPPAQPSTVERPVSAPSSGAKFRGTFPRPLFAQVLGA